MLISKKPQKQKSIRHAEYYDMVEIFDKLYAKSTHGAVFQNLMEIIQSDTAVNVYANRLSQYLVYG